MKDKGVGLVLVATVLAVGGLVGCSNDDASPAPTPVRTQNPGIPGRTDVQLRLVGPIDEPVGSPRLAYLDVSGDVLATRPSFDPAISRYAVNLDRERSEGDPLEVVVTASTDDADDVIRVAGKVVEAGVPRSVSTRASGRVIPIRVTSVTGGEARYELMPLPRGFPIVDVSILDPSRVGDGALYVGLYPDPAAKVGCGSGCFLAILDDFGVPLAFLRADDGPGDLKVQPDGSLTFQSNSERPGGAIAAKIYSVDRSLRVTREIRTRGIPPIDSHDFLIRPDGVRVFLGIGHDRRPVAGDSDPGAVPIIDGLITAVAPDGRKSFRWSSADHVRVRDSLRDLPDYFHINSISQTPDGNYLVSARGTSQVLEVDHLTGKVLWRLGGDSSEFRFVGDPLGGLCGQHTATSTGRNRILVFDNGRVIPVSDAGTRLTCPSDAEAAGHAGVSRVAEYVLNHRAGTARLRWSYGQETSAPSLGSAQRLRNGNTLIGWGNNDSALLASEVTRGGDVVLEISATYPSGVMAMSYRVFRFAA